MGGKAGHGGVRLRHEQKGNPWYDQFAGLIYMFEQWALKFRSSLNDTNTVRFYTLDTETNVLPHAFSSRADTHGISMLYGTRSFEDHAVNMSYVSGGAGADAKTSPGFVVPFPVSRIAM